MVATRDTLARDCPTQLRGPSAKGKYRLGRLLSSAWCTQCQGFILPQERNKYDRIALEVKHTALGISQAARQCMQGA